MKYTPSSHYSALVLDVDGTLLNSKHEISSITQDSIQKIKDKGKLIILATGRNYTAIAPYVALLRLTGSHIICDGAVIYSTKTNTAIKKLGIDISCIVDIMLFLESRKITYVINFEEISYTKEYNSDIQHLVSYGNTPPEIFKTIDQLPSNVIPSMVIITNSNHLNYQKIYEDLADSFGQKFTICKSTFGFIEILKKGVSKGVALRHLLKELQIQPKHVVGIGDGENDLSFLSFVGLSIAMGNAVESVKSSCNIETKTCDEEGLSLVLDKIFHN